MHEAESPENLPSPPANPDGDDPYALFRNRDFRLYLAGRLVSVLGQQMLTVAVAGNFTSAPARRSRWASSASWK